MMYSAVLSCVAHSRGLVTCFCC